MMKKVRSFLCIAIALILIAASFPIADFAIDANAATFEKAIFPAPQVYLTQIAFESYSHGAQNAIDIAPGGNVFAPFTGKIVQKDANWGFILLQSTNKVYYADGTLDYMTVGFMHDSNISDLYVGQTINQGISFYQAGGMGNGNPNAYGIHVHISVLKGKVDFVNPYGNGNVFAYNAFFVNTAKTKIVKAGNVESGNSVYNGAPNSYSGLWKATDTLSYDDQQLVKTTYPSHCTIKVTENDKNVMSLPCSNKTNSKSDKVESAPKGTTYEAIGLILNTEGNLWYKVKAKNGKEGYIFAGNVSFVSAITSDITGPGISVPANHTQGKTYGLTGSVNSSYSELTNVSVYVYSGSNKITGGTESVNGKSYPLGRSAIDNQTEFNKLAVGQYTYKVTASYKSYYAKNDKTYGTKTGSVTVFSKTFNVVSGNVSPDAPQQPTTIIYPNNGGIYKIAYGGGNNMYLDFSCSSNNVQIYENCDGHSDPAFVKSQYFKLTHIGDGWYTIINIGNGKCVDIENTNPASGTNIMQWDCYPNDGQLYRFYDAGNGYCYIKSKLGTYVDKKDGDTSSDTNVWSYEFNGTVAQKWKLMLIEDIISTDETKAINNKHFTNAEKISFSGWAFSNRGKPVTFEYILDSASPVTIKNCNRPDVKKVYSQSCAYTDVGYGFAIDLSKLSVGKHTMKIIATSFFGTSLVVSNICFYVDAHIHSYSSSVTTKPSCSREGVRTFSCSCGHSYTEAIAKLRHTNDGEDNRCDVCGYALTGEPSVSVQLARGGKIFKIVSKVGSDKYLDFDYTSSNVQILTDSDGHSNPGFVKSQYFTITHVGDGWYSITNIDDNLAADVAGANPAPGTNVQQCPYVGNDAQLFRFYDVGDGSYYIKSKLGCYLEVENGKNSDNANVQVGEFSASKAQKWKLVVHSHSYSSAVTTEATCLQEGIRSYTCNGCLATYTESIPKGDHSYGDWSVIKAASCSTAGRQQRNCTRCNAPQTREIAINTSAHKWDNGKITTTATCKVSGVKTYTCQHNSKHTYTEDLGVNASNHVSTKNVAEVKATCTVKGSTAGVYCNDCSKYISGHKEIAINPSNHVNTKTVPATPATFDKVGYTEGVYCNDCKKYISGHKEISVLMNIGDVDGNGKIDAADARLALRAAVGLDTLSDAQKKSADVDFDGKVTSSDARLILRAAVGLEDLKKRSK